MKKEKTDKLIDNFMSEEPPRFKPDMESEHRPVKENHICDMCGEQPAELVILNPNRFPDNDWDVNSDYWDVCNECNEFISWGMGKAMDMVLSMPPRSKYVRFRVGKQFRVRMSRRRFEALKLCNMAIMGKLDDEALEFLIADLKITEKEVERAKADWTKLMLMYYRIKMKRMLSKHRRNNKFTLRLHMFWWGLSAYLVMVGVIFDIDELLKIFLIWVWMLVAIDMVSALRGWRRSKNE